MGLSFWDGKRVFLTGHTGFKGAWMSRILVGAGAKLTGYALAPAGDPNLFALCGVEGKMDSILADIRDFSALKKAFEKAAPEIVIHMAAQPIVRTSYEDPVYTYETNVMGTVHLLECLRTLPGVHSFVNVTTDKVYQNNEWCWGYRENDPLDGFDPYSNSKSCSELVTHSYKNSFFSGKGPAISTARAGNVIGGGDFSKDRILPDCIRAASEQKTIIVRNPYSIRPYQYVLEPVFAYLLIAQRQYEDPTLADYYNVGPDDADCVSTGNLVDLFCNAWGHGQEWRHEADGGPHEANFLKLDCSKIKTVLNWSPRWNIRDAIQRTVDWTQVFLNKQDVCGIMDRQIQDFFE